MKVQDIMTKEVLTVKADTSVNDIAKLMGEHNISGVPVVDDQQRVIGIITEQDLIVRNTRLELPHFIQIMDLGRIPLEWPGHAQERMRHMLGAQATDVMTHKVITVSPETEIEDVAELMVKHGVNPVPVVEAERLIGIISRADLIDMMAAELG
jgi:CBS domain-containing protein